MDRVGKDEQQFIEFVFFVSVDLFFAFFSFLFLGLAFFAVISRSESHRNPRSSEILSSLGNVARAGY